MSPSEKVLRPVIISASRATDLPAFHGEWFVESLKAGHCLWTNPFNKAVFKVDFENARFVVFWSKNPEPFLRHLPELDARGLGYYFLFTLNDYEKEGFEPGVPPLEKRVETFKRLSDKLGPERVVWRFDPLIYSRALTPAVLAERIDRIAKRLSDHTKELITSFIDIARYRRARESLLGCHEASLEEIEATAALLQEGNSEWKLRLKTCAENHDLSAFGIERGSCVDASLIRRLRPDDQELLAHLASNAKDKGQRKDCLCAKSKDIGFYDSCAHGCLYCYAMRES